MNLWQSFEKTYCASINQGIAFHFENGLDRKLRVIYLDFARWLRNKYVFPVHLTVYILNQEKIRLRNGTLAYGSFRWNPIRTPRIKIPSKVEEVLLSECSIDEVYIMIMSSFVHELTHYFQWVSGLEQTSAVSERQANYYRYRIIEQYNTDRGARKMRCS